MASSLGMLSSVVDGVVAVPVDELCVSELQAFITSVGRQRDRLDGVLSKAAGQLAASTGGRVPTEQGGDRSVAGWLAQATGSRRVRPGRDCGCRRRCGTCR